MIANIHNYITICNFFALFCKNINTYRLFYILKAIFMQNYLDMTNYI